MLDRDVDDTEYAYRSSVGTGPGREWRPLLSVDCPVLCLKPPLTGSWVYRSTAPVPVRLGPFGPFYVFVRVGLKRKTSKVQPSPFVYSLLSHHPLLVTCLPSSGFCLRRVTDIHSSSDWGPKRGSRTKTEMSIVTV